MGYSAPRFAFLLVFMGFALYIAFSIGPGYQGLGASNGDGSLMAKASGKIDQGALKKLTSHVKAQPSGASCTHEALQPLTKMMTLKSVNWTVLDQQIDGLSGEEKFNVAASTAVTATPENTLANAAVMYVMLSAARDGSALAMNELGMSLLTCQYGVGQDLSEARSWFKKAVEAGDDYAMLNLGRMYLRGEAGSGSEQKNTKQGLLLIERCAKAGNDNCVELMNIYENAKTVAE